MPIVTANIRSAGCDDSEPDSRDGGKYRVAKFADLLNFPICMDDQRIGCKRRQDLRASDQRHSRMS